MKSRIITLPFCQHKWAISIRPSFAIFVLMRISLSIVFILFFASSSIGQEAIREYDEASKYATEVRQRLNHFFFYLVGRIEHTADSIVAVSGDHEIDEAAIQWKIYAIGAAQRSAFMRDPVVSSIDLRVLLNQMYAYFNSGIGQDRFGPHTSVALRCTRSLEKQIGMQVMSAVAESVDLFEKTKLVQLYVKGHPLGDHYFTRESTVPFFETLLSSNDVKLKELAGNIQENINDMSDRINIYTELLPKMMRWEMELMLLKMWDHQEISGKYDRMMSIMDTLTYTMVEGPVWTESLIQSMFIEVESERRIMLEALEDQRLAMQEFASSERAIILEAMRAEREQVMKEVSVLSTSSIDQGGKQVQSITEDWFNKALILLGIFLAGLFIYGWIRRSGSHS